MPKSKTKVDADGVRRKNLRERLEALYRDRERIDDRISEIENMIEKSCDVALSDMSSTGEPPDYWLRGLVSDESRG